MPQVLLFADPKPLVTRLGRDFFRDLPGEPGVYLMRDERENILYVGKAKNLRQRLSSYRVANPDRMSRRHLRLVNQVARIEWQLCPDETSALVKEAELLRSIRPKFNRAGVWPGKPRSLLWQVSGTNLQLKVADSAAPDWQVIGRVPGARWLRLTLARLVWLATHPESGISGLPAGWAAGIMGDEALIHCGKHAEHLALILPALTETGAQPLIDWIKQRASPRLTKFETAWRDAELELLAEFKLDRLGAGSVTQQAKDEQRLFAFA